MHVESAGENPAILELYAGFRKYIKGAENGRKR